MECNLLWCGKYIQNWENQLHSHNYFQILAVVSGSANVIFDTESFTAPKGSILIVPPNRAHKINCSQNSLQVTDAKFLLDCGELKTSLLSLPCHLQPSNFDRVVCLFENILSESSLQTCCFKPMIQAMFLQILVELVRMVPSVNTVVAHCPHQPTWKGIDLKSLTDYIHSNYTVIDSLDEISAFAHINKTTLIELFKQIFGITPMRYIHTLRLQLAKKLLSESDQNISDIAQQTGYQSIHYFSRDFKRHTGMTPMLYRIQNGKNRYFTYCTGNF